MGTLAVVATACGSQAAAHPPTAKELRWTGKFDLWNQPGESFGAGCSYSFRSIVGRPPTRRLERFAEDALAACKHFQRGATGALRVRNYLFRQELRAGTQALSRVDRALTPLRPGMEPLAKRDAPGFASRI